MAFSPDMTVAQKKRDLAERRIALMVDDDDFRRDIVDDPLAAMRQADLVADHDELVDDVAHHPTAQAYAAFGLGLKKLGEVPDDEIVYPTWVLGPTCSAPAQS